MICPECRTGVHRDCRGGTWCCCQHRGVEEDVAEIAPEPAATLSIASAPSQDAALVMEAYRSWGQQLRENLSKPRGNY